MRYVLYGITCFVVFLCSLEMLLTVNSRNSRKDELEQAVTLAVRVTMENLAKGNVKGEDALETMFEERVRELIHSESELTIQILAKDVSKGLLSVCVQEEFTYPTGKKGTLSVSKTAILDGLELEKEEGE
ncbi:MAG: hypothetical protein ACI39H_03095 [Lachnospiraceae bacterium]